MLAVAAEERKNVINSRTRLLDAGSLLAI